MRHHTSVQDIRGSRVTGILPALDTTGALDIGLFRRTRTAFGWHPATMDTVTIVGIGVSEGVIGTADDNGRESPRAGTERHSCRATVFRGPEAASSLERPLALFAFYSP